MLRLGLALGSNQGNRGQMLVGAMQAIMALCSRLDLPVVALEASSLWETAAWSPAWAPRSWSCDYVNAVLVLTLSAWPSTLTADQFLAQLLRIESRMGRRRQLRYSPRTIDIDWLYREDAEKTEAFTSSSVRLILPHVALQERAFVLLPLCELYPAWRHPLTGKTASAMLEALTPEAFASCWKLCSWPWMAFATDPIEGHQGNERSDCL